MKITFLGTGTSTGNPMLLCNCRVCTSTNPKDIRLRSSVLIEDHGTQVLIDCGPDFRQQALRANIKHLDGVLITHEHYDHVGGLDDMRPYCLYEEMPVFSDIQVLNRLKILMPYSFRDNPYPGVPLFRLHPVQKDSFFIKQLEIKPIHLMHFELPVLGFRIGDMAYLTDFNAISDEEIQKLSGCKLLIVDALRHEKHISHNSLEEALSVINQVQPEKAFLIHMSHDMGLHEEMNAALPEHIRLSFDGLIIDTEKK